MAYITPYFWASSVTVYDGKFLFGYTYNAQSIEIYDINTGTLLDNTFYVSTLGQAYGVAVINENVFVHRNASPPVITKHNYATRALISANFITPPQPWRMIAYNDLLYISSSDQSVYVYNPDTGAQIRSFNPTAGTLQYFTFANGKIYAAAAGFLKVIDEATGTVLNSNYLNVSGVRPGISVIGKYIFVSTGSGVKLYNMETSALIQTYSKGINSLATYGPYLYALGDQEGLFRYDITPYAFTAPIAPVITSVVASWQGTATINFTQSTSSSSSPVTGYSYSINGGTTFTNAATTTSPINISGLVFGRTYQVCIKATSSSYGDSAISNIVATIPTYPCFLQGTRILRQNRETGDAEYSAIETLRKGDLIKTYSHGYVPIHTIGHAMLHRPNDNPKTGDRLYRFTPDDYPELDEDLCITGNHCILHHKLSDKKRAQVEKHMGKIFITEGKYRVPAFLDNRAKPYAKDGSATIWHFALENNDIYDNYGIFANGLLVESSSIRFMNELSNMELVLHH